MGDCYEKVLSNCCIDDKNALKEIDDKHCVYESKEGSYTIYKLEYYEPTMYHEQLFNATQKEQGWKLFTTYVSANALELIERYNEI